MEVSRNITKLMSHRLQMTRTLSSTVFIIYRQNSPIEQTQACQKHTFDMHWTPGDMLLLSFPELVNWRWWLHAEWSPWASRSPRGEVSESISYLCNRRSLASCSLDTHLSNSKGLDQRCHDVLTGERWVCQYRIFLIVDQRGGLKLYSNKSYNNLSQKRDVNKSETAKIQLLVVEDYAYIWRISNPMLSYFVSYFYKNT